jgi:S-DNA-T family DNA segregation ATPase FtsK/SpoIIIE
MSRTLSFNRMPRIQDPLPQAEVRIPPPPTIASPPRSSWLQALLPLAGVFVMMGLYGGLRGDWTLAIPMAAMSGVSAITSMVAALLQRRSHQRQVEESRATYARALDQKRAELERLRQVQRRIRTSVDPDLETLLTRARGRAPRLWERRPEHDDFLNLRLGIGDLPSSVPVLVPSADRAGSQLEEAWALKAEYDTVPQVPVTASLCTGPLGIAGPLAGRTAVARGLICSLAVHHSPDEVHLLAVCSPDRAAEWRWLRWLPHTYALDDDAGRYYLAQGTPSAQRVLKGLLEELHHRQNRLYAARQGESLPSWPWLVLLAEDSAAVRDDPAAHLLLSPAGRQLSATAVFLVDQAPQVPTGCSAVVEVQASGQLRCSSAGPGGATLSCWPERADVMICEELARSLAPIQVHTLQPESALPTSVRLLDLLGIDDVEHYDVAQSWGRRSLDHHLKAPIGERRGHQAMILDLNHTGHGPHGLIAGTTGSGKSELLQTLIVGLALTHHPHDVGFVLVDFKGGGTFSELVALPHAQGLVTDLSGNLTERALVALGAEMDRRKRLFNDAGVNDIDVYQQLYWRGGVEEPLPRLVVIIDEFAELASDHPDFMDGLIVVARVGRSLGLHLILATQSPAGVVKQQVWANAKFRICLRVESRQESMEMLHRPEAASLPRVPGRGYLQVGNNDVFELFQVARVAGSYRSPADAERPEPGAHIVISQVSGAGRRRVLSDSGQTLARPGRPERSGPSDLSVTVSRLAAAAREMDLEKLPSPWPDPLPDRVPLPDLLRQQAYGGWNGSSWAAGQRPWLGAILGLLDDPANQRQDPLVLELSRQDGQMIVLGAPGSGKEMLARTLVTGLACTHTPGELHLYLLEFGGQALQVLAGLPHVGGVLTPLDDERVRRLLRRLLDVLDERKRLCSQYGADGLVSLRDRQPETAPPAIVVVITGFAEFRILFQDELLQLTRLIREGGPYGVHVVLLGDRAGDVPTPIGSVVARRIALRLADADEYAMVLGTRVRPGADQRFPPGRGWYGRPPLEFQTASPGYEEDESGQVAELQRLVNEMGRAWRGSRPEPVALLPREVALERVLPSHPELLAGADSPRLVVPLGLDGVRLEPVLVDLVNDGPSFIVSSTPQGGKTTLLCTWVLALATLNSPRGVRFVLISGRRDSLRPLADLPHVLDYCRAPEDACRDGVLVRLQSEIRRREVLLSERRASADAPPAIVAMFDDYDEFFAAVGEQQDVQEGLSALAKRGRDVDVHIVVAGPLPDMGGIAFRDPLLRQLKIGRSGFLLRVLDASDQNPLGLRLRADEVKQMPPGRGYVVRHGAEQMLQVATAGDASAVAEWVERLRHRWADAGAEPACWPETCHTE